MKNTLLSKYKSMPLHKILLFLGSLIILLLAFSCVAGYICGPAEGYFHSDCSDSLYWANASVESGKIIDEDFRYAAILPFSANLWMIPLINIFGVTMKTQTISMVIFLILYLASQLWVFRKLKFSWSFNFLASAFMLMLLSSSVKMREIMWEHVIYYSLSILFFNCLLALALSVIDSWRALCQNKSRGSIVTFFAYTAILCLLSLCVSTNGFQIIVMTTLPVAAGVVLEWLTDSKQKLTCRANVGKMGSAVGVALFSLVGLKVLDALKGDVVADYTSVYSKFSVVENWDDNLFKFPMHFLTLIGYQNEKVEFLTKEGITNLLAVCVFIILCLTPIISLFFYNKFKRGETRIALLSSLSLSAFLMFVYICGNISNVNWRLIPLVASCAFATLCVLYEIVTELSARISAKRANDKKENEGDTGYRLAVRGGAIILCALAVFSIFTYRAVEEIPEDYGQNNTVHRLTAALEANGLEYGYATFWYSQSVTMLSDSRVKCREILATEKNGAKTDYYQSSKNWYLPQEGVDEYFVLLTNGEYEKVSQNQTWQRWESEQLKRKITDVKGFVIFVFDGYLEGIY